MSHKEKMNRRQALAKLGLTAATIYAAPTVLRIDRSARAQAPSGAPGAGGGKPSCTPGQAKKGLC